MTDDLVKRARDAMRGIAGGPWQVTMSRNSDGATGYHVAMHDHCSIAVDKRGYWADDYQPACDECGYYQPDDAMDCAQWRVDTARFIAASRDLVPDMADRIDDLQVKLSECKAALHAADVLAGAVVTCSDAQLNALQAYREIRARSI
jgi:hypothetical protein